jgi:hypothetical protein
MLPPLPQHPQCCNRAATIVMFAAATLRATATAADAATTAVPLPSFRQHCAGALLPPPMSRCCAAATATNTATAADFLSYFLFPMHFKELGQLST